MRHALSTVLVLGAAAALLAAAATAADFGIRIPLPPIPRIVVPKPPAPRVTIEAPRSKAQQVLPAPRQYEYYPDARVYFDPTRQLYFFMEANRWAAKTFLPPQIKVRVGAPVIVELDTENPYEYDEEVRRTYSRRHEERARGGYQNGFDDGYEQGYQDGYDAGYKESFNQAYRDGYQACLQDRGRPREEDRPGYNRGRKEGWDKRDRD
jgi:hypothetical protein